MRSNKYSFLTLRVQLGDIEIYTAPDMGFMGSFGVTPKIHSHPYYEIIVVIEGRLRICVLDDADIELEKGNLCVIPPNCYHSTNAYEGQAKMLALRFSYCRVNGDGRIYDDFCKALERVNEPVCKHLISLYGVPYGECREPFMPLDDEAKNDLYENAWSVIEGFRNNG